ncbi:MAG: glycosyltransferase family 4 protein [Candidatus Colwellbacteria bacterium]|nr:glycosyltransferase family 4 protein [Candidatus Colwellbacteria bacterium]
MRIGLFTDSYLPMRHGVQAHIDSLREGLQQLGHEVYIYAPRVPGYKDETQNIFRLSSFRVIKKPDMRIALPHIKDAHIRDIVKMPLDIVHTHSPFSIGFLGEYIAKKQKIPMFYTHHTDYTHYASVYMKEKVFLPRFAKKYIKWFADKSTAVIAPSEKVRQMLVSYNVTSPIHILPSGINCKEFVLDEGDIAKTKELKKRLGFGIENKIILYFGRIGAEKNIDFLIKSFSVVQEKMPQTRFVVAGDGSYLKHLRALAKKLGLQEKVVFTGFVPEEEKKLYYGMADAFVFASHTETQGLVILEALASGLPVVALRDSAIEAAVADGISGFLVEGGETDFADKVLQVLKNLELAVRLRAGAKQTALNFDEKNSTLKMLQLYENYRVSSTVPIQS